MLFVDTHVHVSPHWFEPIEVLQFHMERSNVEKAVLLQFSGQENNHYILDWSRRFPHRFRPMVYVDHKRADAVDLLRNLAHEGAAGIRLKTSARSPGKDELALWRCCNELHLVVSCQGKARDFGSDEFQNLVRAMPDCSFALEHYGQIDADEKPPYES